MGTGTAPAGRHQRIRGGWSPGRLLAWLSRATGYVRLLDLYCGQGGVAVGYTRAGITDIVGVDTESQPRYPFTFVQADAFEFLAEHWREFDVFHGSPVCKGYSVMKNLPWLKGREYPAHILPLREAFDAIGRPYVIENVMGARYGAAGLAKRGLEAHGMQAGWLCGTMFGLPLYRHRLFETNWPWLAPGHPQHRVRVRPASSRVGRARDVVFSEEKGRLASWQHRNGAQAAGVGVGHARGWQLAAAAMQVPWMNRDGTTQAVPPAYTEFIGRALLAALDGDPGVSHVVAANPR